MRKRRRAHPAAWFLALYALSCGLLSTRGSAAAPADLDSPSSQQSPRAVRVGGLAGTAAGILTAESSRTVQSSRPDRQELAARHSGGGRGVRHAPRRRLRGPRAADCVHNVAESGLSRPRAAACANSGRRGMGRLPRKWKPRGPCGDPVGILPGPRTYHRRPIGKIRQNSGKILFFF